MVGEKDKRETLIKTSRMKTFRSDLVIIGGGLAGLYTALKLAPLPVTVVMSSPLGEGTASQLAQGGIAAAMGSDDSPKLHSEDTIKAGAGLVDAKISELTALEARRHIENLLEYGVPFDHDSDNKLKLTREAAHGKKRIVHVKGDSAGKAIMATLIDAVHKTPSIRILDNAIARRFRTDGAKVTGVYIWSAHNMDEAGDADVLLETKAVVLATGGIGGLFSKTTNPLGANGEALAMAAHAGAVIADPEFVQFHPTAIDAGKDPVPLATEALRGEGAVLVNSLGQRFMVDLHEDAELAPRDIVARAVFKELQEGRGAFLDCREAIGENFKDEFPSVYAHCAQMGIDPATALIPVAPAVHYHMGGIFTDALGRTTLNNLWACGEAASTGLHGGNRLASNSLLEAMVFADRVARDITGQFVFQQLGHAKLPHKLFAKKEGSANDNLSEARKRKAAHENSVILEIRQLMYRAAGLERNAADLAGALQQVTWLGERHANNRTVRNMVCAGQFILVAAWQRQESRGGHFRSDFPDRQDKFARRTFLSKTKMKIFLDKILKTHFGDDKNAKTLNPLKLVVSQ